MQEIYETAKVLMKGYCRVCKECNGNACVGEVPGMGGLGTASSFKANINALKKINFNMRLVHDVVEPDTAVSLLGKEFSLPVLAAPIGGVSFNMGDGISEEAYIKSIIFGCREKGIIGCTGDGVPAFIHETGLSVIKEAGGHGISFIKPWEDKELFEKLDKVKESGAGIVGMDIDAAGLITLKNCGLQEGVERYIDKTRTELEQALVKVIGLSKSIRRHLKIKVFGIVTNMKEINGEDLIHWLHARCGKSEEAHAVMKDDLAGGKLPSADFGENAAWWWMMIMALNLNVMMKNLALNPSMVNTRMKRIRFSIINIPGRIIKRSRSLFLRLSKGHPSYDILITARKRIAMLQGAPFLILKKIPRF